MSWALQTRAEMSDRLPAVVAAIRTGVAPDTNPTVSRTKPTMPKATDARRAVGQARQSRGPGPERPSERGTELATSGRPERADAAGGHGGPGRRGGRAAGAL